MSHLTQQHPVSFDSQAIQVITHNGEPYITAREIGVALEYSDPKNAIAKIYNRNKDELERHMGVVNLSTPGGVQEVKAFTEKGIMLISMFSNQPKAKAFRQWAVEVLTHYRQEPAPPQAVQKIPADSRIISNEDYIQLLESKIKGLETQIELDQIQTVKRRRLSDEEKQQIISLTAAGVAPPGIARCLDRPTATIKSFMRSHRKHHQASLDL